jgi:hypothetical protein
MRLFRVLALAIVPLVVTPCVTHARGRLGMGRGHALGGSSSSISTFETFPKMPRGHRRFDRTPFGGAAIPWEPYEVIVREVPVDVPVVVRNPPPSEPPVADPKFVFPPGPSAPESAGSRTVIIQRGSSIEAQSFPSVR